MIRYKAEKYGDELHEITTVEVPAFAWVGKPWPPPDDRTGWWVDRGLTSRTRVASEPLTVHWYRVVTAEEQLADALARVAELEAALRPFADMHRGTYSGVIPEDYRRAATLLGEGGGA